MMHDTRLAECTVLDDAWAFALLDRNRGLVRYLIELMLLSGADTGGVHSKYLDFMRYTHNLTTDSFLRALRATHPKFSWSYSHDVYVFRLKREDADLLSLV